MRWLFGFERALARVSGNDGRSRALSGGLLALGAAFSFAAAASPYSGTPIALPGTFQAENFDRGGESIGYHDLSPGNAGGYYRTSEDVDIIRSADSQGGSYAVSGFQTGEWLAYTVDVAANGRYDIELRVASTSSTAAFHIEIDGVNVSGRVAVPNTSRWSSFRWVARRGVPITAGQHVLKIVADQQHFHLNSVRVTAVATSTPYTGSPIALPGTFETENFDIGGEGIAYHDNTPLNTGGMYRSGEAVDILASTDTSGGGYVVNNFTTGEWLAYTVRVAAAGRYDIELRVSSEFADSAFHVEVDGVNVTGTVAVPPTGSWSTFQWVGKKSVQLATGQQVLTIVSDREYFNLNSARVVAASANTPYSGTPIPVPATFEAENFDRGGQGIAYSDKVAGNAGGQYRISEDVDIVVAADSGGGYVVNNFETGEWLLYTINVAQSASYDIEVRAATMFADSSFHVEIDGVDVTGTIVVPSTGGWSTFQWIGKKGITLAAGTRTLKLVSNQQYFDLNSIRVAPTAPSTPLPDPGAVQFSCTFQNSPRDCGFQEQAKVPGRATIVNVGRDGGTAVRLHTEPGDNNVSGSGGMERNDLWLTEADTDGYQGREHWWAHSLMFPSDFAMPTWQVYVLMDFHQTGGTGGAPFHVMFKDGVWHFLGYGGQTLSGGTYTAPIGTAQKNVWYDFVYHVKWSSGDDGFFVAWVNGVKKLDHRGPTMYAGQNVYLKLANYHTPVCNPYPGCTGPASSVIHDRIVRGTSALAVSLGPLEGVLELVNGVLTPVQ